jgi:4-diphosphocytidyl-2-C-methyl-D-erythritol kinase
MKGLAYARGIGDELDDLGLSLPYYIVTVFPEQHISTVWAYKNFYPRFDREIVDLKKLISALCISGNKKSLPAFENDFELAVFDYFPAVRRVKSTLLEAGSIFASLSGSGSAVFGLFEQESDALAAMNLFPDVYRKSLTCPGFSMEQ